jgi:hypothetical protein
MHATRSFDKLKTRRGSRELRWRALAPHAVAVAVEVMRVRRQDPDVIVGDIAAGEVWREGRDADVRVGRVAARAIVCGGSRRDAG